MYALLWTEHDYLHGDAFQGFSIADKISTIFVEFSKNNESVYLATMQKRGWRLCAGNLSKNKNFKRLLPSGLIHVDVKGWIRAGRNVERITKVNNTLTYYVFYHTVS